MISLPLELLKTQIIKTQRNSLCKGNTKYKDKIVDFVAIPSGYQLHPSDEFFPTTWQN